MVLSIGIVKHGILVVRKRTILRETPETQAVRKDSDKEFGGKPYRRINAATFGLSKGTSKPHCSHFLRKHAGEDKHKAQRTTGDFSCL